MRRVRPEAEGSQFFVKGGLSYERESTTDERSSPAASASPARRSSKDKRSNRGLVPERGGVGTCVRKGKHNDFETRIECDGGTWKQIVARPAQCADRVRPYQLCRALEKLFAMIAQGLAWHHWGVLLRPGFSAMASLFNDAGAPFFAQMLSRWNTPIRASASLGNGTFTYEARRPPIFQKRQ